jgi:3-methyl-2-oxobutanoate hydroxymethyltransferase
MVTSYDYPTAVFADRAGLDIILVGDSLGMTVLGYDSALPVTMEDMIAHAKAVTRGAKYAFVLGDMPYMSYQASVPEAVHNAGRFMAECGCDAIKLEGGREVVETVEALIRATIPVVAHLGLTPQSIAMFGGFKAQGRNAAGALRIIEDAKALEAAGVVMILLEAVPPEVGKIITERAQVPVIGIGGIASARDVLEFLIAGATAVQVGTASFVDPFIWPKLLSGLEDYLTRHRIERVRDLIGSLET